MADFEANPLASIPITPRSYLTEYDLGMDKDSIKQSFAHHVEYTQGKDEFSATTRDFFKSLALAVRDRLCDRWNKTQQMHYLKNARRVYYLSLEYLPGRLLGDSLLALGVYDQARAALSELGIDIGEVCVQEDDPGLGNGGLGRLAACLLDSMATLGVAATGYGIMYKFGIFRQDIVGGEQVESPDTWMRYGSPWTISRPERLYMIQFGGRVDSRVDESGRLRCTWLGTDNVMAMANDMPVAGYRNGVVNTLRLWSAHATRELDFASFQRGDYLRAVQDKDESENLARVLYPNDHVSAGYELRLKQEYFFVSASIQDAVRRHLRAHPSIQTLPDYCVFQMNETHSSLAVPELLRLLLDEYGLEWDEAWSIAVRSFAYTNHTIMPEALEAWSVPLLENLLPRHLQIIYEINRRLLDEVRLRWPEDLERIRRMSLVEESVPKRIRMANLAIAGSFSINGVSELHSRILRARLFPDFAEMSPTKFRNQTNGITPRRWLHTCNPPLSSLIDATIGEEWKTDLEQLSQLAPYAEAEDFRARFAEAKRTNKSRLAQYIEMQLGIAVDPESMFDVQVKRIHEYKRQLLNLLHLIAQYRQIRSGACDPPVPRTVIFAGKAAPGYRMAKDIIRLIHSVAAVVNSDPAVSPWLKIVFLPNYSVSVAELVVPAADLSEQISTAGTEASGTGNMKLALNGALTIGTYDGANIEIMQAVGMDNMFMFGMSEQEVETKRHEGYDPMQVLQRDRVLAEVIESVRSGEFSRDEPQRFAAITDALLCRDRFYVLADFRSYRFSQQVVDAAYRDQQGWTRKAIRTIAAMGRFSSDSTACSYARDIWRVPVERP